MMILSPARLTSGAPAVDAPVTIEDRSASLLDQLGGHFDLLILTATKRCPTRSNPNLAAVFASLALRRKVRARM